MYLPYGGPQWTGVPMDALDTLGAPVDATSAAAEIGPLREHELGAAVQLFASVGTMDISFLRELPLHRTFAIRIDAELVALVYWRVAQVLFRGRTTPIALIDSAVSPQLQQDDDDILALYQPDLLASIKEDGCVLAGLESSVATWHRRNGWGACATTLQVGARPEELRPAVPPEDGATARPTEIGEVAALHGLVSRRRFGLLERPQQLWARLLGFGEPYGQWPRSVLWRSSTGRPEGYLILGYQPERPGSPHLHVIVHEFVTATANAYLGLLHYLSEQRTLLHIPGQREVAVVRLALPQDDPLFGVLREPQRVGMSLRVDKMLRAVDLSQLAFPASGVHAADAEELVLLVDDPQAPWNSGQWRVYAGEGEALWLRQTAHARHTVPPKRDPWIRIPAIGFGPLISRNVGVGGAISSGLITASGAEAIGKLEALLGAGLAPYSPDPW